MHQVEFSIEPSGCKAILRSNVTTELLSYLKSRNAVALELNVSKGWTGDLRFLAELPSIKKLALMQIGGGEIDLSPLQYLTELTYLDLSTYSKGTIDFKLFPSLVECSLEWQPGFSSIFEVRKLKKLFLNRYSGTSSRNFAKLKELEDLSLKGSAIEELSGISTLSKLRRLEIGLAKNLQSLAGIEQLSQLEELDINTCKKISSIQPVSALKHLHTLFIINSGDIESLKPIDSLTELRKIIFYDTTNITDGDLSPLTRQKNLVSVSFKNRKHYTHKCEDFES